MTLAGRRVLIVEDHFLIAHELSEMMAEAGAKVVGPCLTVEQALARLARKTPDCALLDVDLGNQTTSLAVARELTRRGVPFVVVTGYGAETLAPALRAAPVITKPFVRRELMAVIARSFGGREGKSA